MTSALDAFDDAYWRNVERYGCTCRNCGNAVKPCEGSWTGWTHDGVWQGLRCPGQTCSAAPVER